MPHSSGGGSHGGGSHGGSHGSHGSSGPRISRTHFHGSRRYVYYNRNNEPKYFYADDKFKPGFHPLRLLVGIFYLPFLIVIFFMFKEALPIVPKNYDHTIIIKDEADVIDNEDALYSELERFMKKTGVTPSVVTVHNESWDTSFSLEEYAYSRYLQEFDDEMHWLIVYSEPIDPNPDFNDWYWEGMQGDDTDPVLKEKYTSMFNERFHNMLWSGDKVDESLKTSFGYVTDHFSKKPDMSELFSPLFMLGFVLFHAFFMLGIPNLKYRNAVLAPEEGTAGNSAVDAGTYQPRSYDSYTPQSGMNDLYSSQKNNITGYVSKTVVCPYCGITYASKYKRCPGCNAANDNNV